MNRFRRLAPPAAVRIVSFSPRPCASRLARAALLASLALLAACHRERPAAPAPQPVVAAAVQARPRSPVVTLPGEVQARYSTPLSFRVAGKLVERRVRLGDAVRAGEAVARLDPADFDKNAASSRAQLDAVQHRFDYASQQLARDRAQARENLIAPAQLEQTEDAWAGARAQREQAAQQAALTRDQLRYATLVADHAGVITAEQADTGQNVGAGQPVYTLAWDGARDVVCDVPENVLARLAVGSRAEVTLPALPGRRLAAQVRELAPGADPQSHTWRVKLTLDEMPADLRLGMTANVSFTPTDTAQAEKSWTLPVTALFHDGTAPAVWIVRAGSDTLELRPVTVSRYGERTVDIGAGLADGERVVLQGVHTVSAGQKVRVVAPLHPEDFAS